MVDALNYAGRSEVPDEQCANCQFFTARTDGALGSCIFFAQGLVAAGGHCDFWVEEPV